MKITKLAVFCGAAASWTGYPAGRTRDSEGERLIGIPTLLNISDGSLIQVAVFNDSEKLFIQLQAVTVSHVLRDIRDFTVHQQFWRYWYYGRGLEFSLCARAAGQQHRQAQDGKHMRLYASPS